MAASTRTPHSGPKRPRRVSIELTRAEALEVESTLVLIGSGSIPGTLAARVVRKLADAIDAYDAPRRKLERAQRAKGESRG